MAQNDNSGRGWHGDSEGHAKAGRKGGRASSGSFRKGSERAREAGRKGGRARARQMANDDGGRDEGFI